MGRPLLTKIVIVALVVSAALFALGAALEHHAESNEEQPVSGTASAPTEGQHAETPAEHAGESAGGAEKSSENPGGSASSNGERSGHTETAAERRSEKSSEEIFGVNPDALPLVIAAVAVSLLLAGGLWWRGEVTMLLALIVLVGLGAAVFDVREAVHQADHSREGIMVVATLVALLHLAVAGCAAALALGWGREPAPRESAAT
jgi:lysylphosphatidylglycerol synthetase-like protein (DUF2156 family)